jgi:hypothetical protein
VSVPTLDEATMTAFVVRRFQVLARPSLGNLTVDDLDGGDRWEAVVEALHAEGADPFDALALTGLEGVDLVCGQVVRRLSKSARDARGALEALAVLDRRRKVALYYALPKDRREPLEHDANFLPVIAPFRGTESEAVTDLDELFKAMVQGAREAAETGEPPGSCRRASGR